MLAILQTHFALNQHNLANMVQNILSEAEEKKLILNAYKALMRDCSEILNTPYDRKQLREAFVFSNEAHKDMRRKSGEPYILHPIGVARIVVNEIGLKDKTSVIAALLHDVVEDTVHELSHIQERFGETVAKIVDGLTKISEVIEPDSTTQAETLRKMLLTMSNDIRVALVKIADRLHNMRTIQHMKPDKQHKIASETVFLYAPLAHRFGLYDIKSELEDLSLEVNEPEVYQTITQKLKDTKTERDKYITNFIRPLKEKMAEIGVKCTIKGRVKSITSIYNKMKRQNVPFEDVFDIFAVRIIILPQDELHDDREDCWKAYNAISTLYHTNPKRLRDWLSTPKSNGYEALHTTVVGPEGRWVEVQIRTERMDYAAEKGVAAHWKYKEGGSVEADERLESWLSRVRDLLESENITGIDFYNEFKTNIVAEQIFVFTPRGEIKMMPLHSTALDFAYEIHTNIGNKSIGAKVNYELQALNYELRNGDKIEIITSDKHAPQQVWLNFVTTTKAKNRILDALKIERKKIEGKGKKIFDRKAQQLGFTEDHIFVRELLNELNLKSLADFYFLLGSHKLDMKKIQSYIDQKQRLVDELKHLSDEQIQASQKRLDELVQKTRGVDSDTLVINKEMKADGYKIATCCHPIPGDEVVGFVEEGKQKIVIHRTNCPKAIQLMTYDGNKMVKAKWHDAYGIEFLAGIKIHGADRFGVLKDIVRIISNKNHIVMRSIMFDTFDGMYEGTIKLFVQDINELNALIQSLREVEGVMRVRRM